MDIKGALARVIKQLDLTTEEMQSVMRDIMTGQCSEAQIGAFLMGLRMKSESLDEIEGAARVMRELATPGILAILAPIAVGFGLGVGALAGFLAGAIGSGTLMAVFLANAGGAWDNAKKYIEGGQHGGKGSEAHKAAVVGDT
ncbi:sodium/proton-translocating pyrophosphatase, partial [uncultured Spongiibacter sp.]|uniref:sodium/proton-translocating pyrophosphatase n=1 Tax=uncultured Spongiibacter sp. TaxID=870896 RepID=UPI0025994718